MPRADSGEAADAVSGEPLGGTCCRAFVSALHVERPVTRLRSLVMARSALGVTADQLAAGIMRVPAPGGVDQSASIARAGEHRPKAVDFAIEIFILSQML